MSESPVVVIPAPIDIMDWNYDVEREILEKQGVRSSSRHRPRKPGPRCPTQT